MVHPLRTAFPAKSLPTLLTCNFSNPTQKTYHIEFCSKSVLILMVFLLKLLLKLLHFPI